MVIGLTGGIGSGKTTVLNCFKKLGIPTYVADVEAKNIMNTSVIVKQKITNLLGDKSYINSQLNRVYIASKVFNDKKLLDKLNAIVHPEVHKSLDKFVKAHSSYQYIIYESAILFENNNQHLCTKVIVVTAPLEKRIKRVMDRDSITKEQVLSRINSQWSQEEKVEKSHFIIENDEYFDLEKKVMDIHKKLTA